MRSTQEGGKINKQVVKNRKNTKGQMNKLTKNAEFL